MNELLPLSLIISWTLFFGFLNSQQRHAGSFRGESQWALFALNVSGIVGCLVGFGILIYYFMHVAWFYPILLFLAGALVAGIIFGILDRIIGLLGLSLFAFIGWPSAAVWSFFIIRDLPS